METRLLEMKKKSCFIFLFVGDLFSVFFSLSYSFTIEYKDIVKAIETMKKKKRR